MNTLKTTNLNKVLMILANYLNIEKRCMTNFSKILKIKKQKNGWLSMNLRKTKLELGWP